VLDDSRENVVRASWIANKEPKVTILVVNCECVTTKRKIEPHLSHIVGNEICNSRARQSLDVLTKLVPCTILGKLCKLTRTTVRRKVEESSFHRMASTLPDQSKPGKPKLITGLKPETGLRIQRQRRDPITA